VLQADEIIYLEKKRKKAERGVSRHTLKEGESLRTVSNTYGIRLSNLRKMNGLEKHAAPSVGMVLKLR
jgi:hypothetical protein